MSNSYSLVAMYPLPAVFRTVAPLFIFITAILAVFYSPMRAEAQEVVEIVSETFSVDPMWQTETPESVQHNTASGTMLFDFSNEFNEQNYKKQYYLLPVPDFDPTKSFSLDWRQKINSATPRGYFTFGLYSGDYLIGGSRNPREETSASTVNFRYQQLSETIDSYSFTISIDRESFAGGGSGRTLDYGDWYAGNITYSATSGIAELNTVNERTGEVFIMRRGELDRLFNTEMQYLGLSLHAKARSIETEGSIEFEIDDVVLTQIQEQPEPVGASSVLFLPGIQASRLYAGEDIVLPGLPNNVELGDKLWEQTNDKRIELLAMDKSGQSLYDIYTEDVVEEVTGRFFGANIYKGFLQMLEDLKTNIDPGIGTTTIANYLPFAYDWRYSVFDIATDPVQYESETKLLKDEVIALANGSHTGKVTIVAHSNGGLVAKALLHEYGDNELQGLVDKVVLIGTPQLGTPKGVGALLHGQVMEGFGDVLTNDAVLRETILNMPGTYTLLPSTRYLDEVADEPLIRVPDGFGLSVYDGVSDRSELDELLLDRQSVVGTAPTIQEPMQLNNSLLNKALAEQVILDAWQPPAGVEVYEVAGTGIPTPSALHYEITPVTTCPNAAAVFSGSQCEVAMGLKPKLQTTTKGDKTVVLGSARGQLGYKQTLTVNLKQADDLILGNRGHADLTEVLDVQTFVESVIRFPYITDTITTPEFSELLNGYTIHAGHSPVTLRIVTPDGLITGIVDGEVREDISGSQFLTLGGSTYVIVPDDLTDYTLEVTGTGNGIYTLETSTLSPDDVQTVIASFVASTTDTMISTMEVADGEMGKLQTDFNGDGIVDEIRTSTGDLVVSEELTEEVETDPISESQSSATRVGDRTPVSQVLGASVSVESLTAEQHQQMQVLLADIELILDQTELDPDQLVVVSKVLREALSIIQN